MYGGILGMGQPNNPQGDSPKTVNRTLLVVFAIIGLLQIIFLIVGFSFPFQIISIILNLVGLFYTVTQAAAPNFSSIRNIFRKVPRSVNIAIPIVLILLLLLSLAVNYLLFFHNRTIVEPPLSGVTPTHTATSSPTPTVTVSPSPTFTPTSIITPSPEPTGPVKPGPPFLVDPMTSPNNQDQWDHDINQPFLSCSFTSAGYDIKAPANDGGGCNTEASTTILTNFIYEIDMKIITGITSANSGVGLTFRYDNLNPPSGYSLSFKQDGTYYMYASNKGAPGATLGTGGCPSFLTGPNQTNLLDVEVQGSIITLFVNNTYVTTATDNQFKSGQIGVQIGSGPTSSEVVFSNLKIWKL
jgi:3-keto-disaccharide hydrolase